MKFLKKWRLVLLLIIVLISYIISVKVYIHPRINDNGNTIEVTINKVKGGYGYILSSNNKVLIKQKCIPAIQEKRVFCSAEGARKTANLVKRKIVRKESPTVSLEELKDLNINLNCVDLY